MRILELELVFGRKALCAVFHGDFCSVGSSRDTCHALERKCLVKEWQKKWLDEEEWF